MLYFIQKTQRYTMCLVTTFTTYKMDTQSQNLLDRPEGKIYEQDLAISVYCSCKAKPFPKEKLEKYAKPIRVQFGHKDKENKENNIHTFFNRESMSIFGVNSIHQSHPKFIVPYKINMKPLKLPKFRPKFERTETRSRTREKLKIHQEYQDSSININSIPEEKN